MYLQEKNDFASEYNKSIRMILDQCVKSIYVYLPSDASDKKIIIVTVLNKELRLKELVELCDLHRLLYNNRSIDIEVIYIQRDDVDSVSDIPYSINGSLIPRGNPDTDNDIAWALDIAPLLKTVHSGNRHQFLKELI